MLTLDKVTAFITRQGDHSKQVLLINHPYAGFQFPAGTVEDGEDFEAAVKREVGEETGLQQVKIRSLLGELIEQFAGRVFTLRAETVYARPDNSSFDWAVLPRGVGVDALREQDDFVQVSFVEGDVYPNPSYTTYQITGWVARESLTAQLCRRIYHLTCHEDTPPSWQRFVDRHTYTLVWADVTALPDIVWPQSEYWDKYRSGILKT